MGDAWISNEQCSSTCHNQVAIVHNGMSENYEIKNMLSNKSLIKSETDVR